MDYIGLSTLITTAGAALALVIKSIQQSRCTKINCACFSCEREVPSLDD